MAHALTTSSSVPLLETIESILCTATSDPEFGADGVANYTQATLLKELGFSMLVKGGLDQMSKETRSKAVKVAGEVAGAVSVLWKGANAVQQDK